MSQNNTNGIILNSGLFPAEKDSQDKRQFKTKESDMQNLDVQSLLDEIAILRQRDLRFKLLSDNSPGSILFQNEDLIYTWVLNSSHLTGIEQVIGKSDFDLLTPEEANRLTSIKKKLMQAGGNHTEDMLIDHAGCTVHLSLIFQGWRENDENLRGIATFIRDITDQENAAIDLEKQLRGEEILADIANQFLKAEFAHIDTYFPSSIEKMAGYLQADRGFIRFINPENGIIERGFEWRGQSLPRPEVESSGLSLFKFKWVYGNFLNHQSIYIPKIKDIPTYAEEELKFLNNAGFQSMVLIPLFVFDEFTGYLGFGSRVAHSFWSEREKGLLDIFQSTVSNVLERQKKEATLQETTEKYQELVERIPGVVYSVKCGETFTTEYVSTAFEKLTGHKKEFVYQSGFSWMSIIHPDDRTRVENVFNYGIEYQTPIEVEYRILCANGEYVCVIDSSRVTYNENGQPDTVQGIFMDISDRKRDFEEMRRLSQENFRLMTRAYHDSEAKTVLLNEVNHRVKNNLASILGILELEKKRNILSRQDFQYALSDLTSRISGLSKVHEILSSNQWAPVKLDHLIQKVIENSSSSSPIGRQVRLIIQSPPKKLWINSRQATALALILNELTTNSIRHAFTAKDQGTISVNIKLEDKKIHKVRIEFSDDGPGWPEKILAGGDGNVGLQVIKLSVLSPLNGSITFENRNGAVAILVFSLAQQRELFLSNNSENY